jgi:glutamate--cysteine ligase
MSILPTIIDAPIESKADLIRYHLEGSKPKSGFLIGTEHEKFVLDAKTHAPAPYDGPHGIKALLTGMQQRFGYEPVLENGNVIALARGRESVSLEPGGQYELSGAPLKNLHEMSRELDKHISEAKEIASELGLMFLPVGYHPTLKPEEMPVMPKGRYAIMQQYMPKKGQRGLEMMFLTCTTQANLDYSDEKDMARKMRVGFALQPIVTALFANSPFGGGKPSGKLTNRSSVWLDVDPDRSGVLAPALEDGFTFEQYVDYALGVPMYFVYRDNKYINCAGQSFRDFMAGKLPALPGEKPTLFDYVNHLTTVFPDVRLKTYIEMRGADVGSPAMIEALPALWTGILYDDTALNAAEALVRDWRAADVNELRREVPRLGFSAIIKGQDVFSLARKTVLLAVQGLRRRAIRAADGVDETRYLEPLENIVDIEQTEAERLLALYNGAWNQDATHIYGAAAL